MRKTKPQTTKSKPKSTASSKYRDFEVQLGGYVVPVLFQSRLDGGDCDIVDGYWDPQLKAIFINADLQPELVRETFLHECVEAVVSLYELNLPHQAITTLGAGLHQMLGPMLLL